MTFKGKLWSLVGFLGVVVAVFLVFSGGHVNMLRAVAQPEPAPDTLDRLVINDSFGPGERLVFSLGYGFVSAGTAVIEVADTNTVAGHLCYRINSLTESNSFFDNFYKVRDTIVSQIDVDGLYSHHFFKALHEGSYDSRREVVFEQSRGLALYTKDDEAVDTLEIRPYAQDIMSVMYFVRTLPLEVGKTITIQTVTGGEVVDLQVKVLERETVSVPAGEFKCLVVEPLMTTTGVFKHEGRIKVWLTDDRLRMPVLMKSKVVVGSIHGELEEFRLGELNW